LPCGSPDRDARRIGIAAAALCGAYVAAIFVPDSAAAISLGLVVAIVGVPLAMFVRLPRWRESEGWKRMAAWAIAGECMLIAAVATVIRLIVVG
jgi:ABC-type enterobactin transport system permease subunit